jgi:FdhD protein
LGTEAELGRAPGPRTPAHSIEFTHILEWNAGRTQRVQDSLAAEEPLEIRVNEVPLTVTMRTPGHDLELAAGFLLTEGLVDELEHIGALRAPVTRHGGRSNLVEVELDETSFDPRDIRRNFFAASSCGVCGKASIESIRRRGLRAPDRDMRIDPELLCTLPDVIRSQQAVFERTGGLHAAALFDDSGQLLAVREDIGRHNAVDKLVGWALLNHQVPLSRHLLLVSGRGGFEIVQKALAAGIPVVASVSAPSSLAVKLAREMGLTLIGFLRGRRFVLYSGEFRILTNQSHQAAS